MIMYLDLEIQQVAVDLVVNIGVVLLLAQVQPRDVHGGLKAENSNYTREYDNTLSFSLEKYFFLN